jgi:DegV family protein with EDD domain
MKIVTDSAADLTAEEIENLGIIVAPLEIQFPEGPVSSEEISRDDFYNRLRAMWPRIPSTSQPSAGLFTNIYTRLAHLKEEILSIHISSGLSGTINSARLGAADLVGMAIEHIDTLTLSGGERFQVLAASMATRAGQSKEFIVERLHQIQQATEVIYTLDTLAYLAKGGRIGRVQALAGMLLHLKPIIHVDKTDGKYSAVGKDRTMQKALVTITDYLHKTYGSKALWVTVLHGQIQDQADQLAALLQAKLNVAKIEILRISPVLGVHTGPGIVGVAVVPMDLLEDLK